MANSVIIKYSLRLFGSDIHAFEFVPTSNTTLVLCKSGQNREPVSKIKHKWFTDNGFERVFGINAMTSETSQLPDTTMPVSIDENNISWLEMLFTKDGRLLFEELTKSLYENTYKADTRFSVPIPWLLMKDGKIKLKGIENFDASLYNEKHPRTFIGWNNQNSTVMCITVDGKNRPSRLRAGEFSMGATAYESGLICQLLGLTDAGMLDGGAASTMVERDVVVNNVSEGKEKPVSGVLNLFVRGRYHIDTIYHIEDFDVDDVEYEVTEDDTPVMACHIENSRTLTYLHKGDIVKIYGRIGKWALISPVGPYWVDMKYIKGINILTPFELYINELNQYLKDESIINADLTGEQANVIQAITLKHINLKED